METSRPLDALNNSRGKRVIVDLKNGKQFVGTLKSFDIHINVVLENAEERQDNKTKRQLGVVFLRGDMITLISPNVITTNSGENEESSEDQLTEGSVDE